MWVFAATFYRNMPSKKKSKVFRITVGLKMSTKEKLDGNQAPGQCFDGFLCQLVDLWEKTETPKKGSSKKLKT